MDDNGLPASFCARKQWRFFYTVRTSYTLNFTEETTVTVRHIAHGNTGSGNDIPSSFLQLSHNGAEYNLAPNSTWEWQHLSQTITVGAGESLDFLQVTQISAPRTMPIIELSFFNQWLGEGASPDLQGDEIWAFSTRTTGLPNGPQFYETGTSTPLPTYAGNTELLDLASRGTLASWDNDTAAPIGAGSHSYPGMTVVSFSTVPEPSSVSLFAITAAAALLRRRRNWVH